MNKKIIKTYESFVEDKNFNFEQSVIDPILICIRDNHEFLTQVENLPQLAKLGYIYNTLWYDGRMCWGYDGILRAKRTKKDEDEDSEDDEDYGSCEENPKYKIEMASPNGEVDDLLYDAWALHVSRGEGQDGPTSKEFFDLIKNGKPLTDLEKKELKINKTLEDWVEIKTDRNYRYRSLYPNRKSVADHLLCTTGNGYGWNTDGFIIEQAGGADQDSSLYGDWQNAKFSPQIQKVVDSVLSIPQVGKTIDASREYIKELKRKRKEKEEGALGSLKNRILKMMGKESNDEDEDDLIDGESINDIISNLYKKRTGEDVVKEEKYNQYYPISSSSKIYAMLSDEKKSREGITKFDDSYIKGAIEICQDIMAHEKRESEDNVEFAKKFLFKYGFKEYGSQIPKEIDKYALLSEIEDCFLYVTDSLQKSDRNTGDLKRGEYFLYLNDTKNSDYADNNYSFCMSLEGYGLPIGYSNHVDFLKNTPIYEPINHTLHRLGQIKDIKSILLYCNNSNQPHEKSLLSIEITVNDKYNYQEDVKLNDKHLEEMGFEVGSFMMSFESKDYIFLTQKPKPLGRSHPNNTEGKEYFSLNKQLVVLNKSWRKICDFNFDERKFNIMSSNGGSSDIKTKFIEEHKKMKLSDPAYGTYNNGNGKEGKKSLYAHDYILWLNNHGF